MPETAPNPNYQAAEEKPQPFGNPTTGPTLHVAPPPPPPPQAAAAAPSPPLPPNITIPGWVVQILPVIVIVTGAVAVFAQQRADVDQLKTSLIELKSANSAFVSKQVFEIKMNEYDKYQAQMNARFDKLEGLINGLYDRLPSKQHDK